MTPSPASRRRHELTRSLPVNGADLPMVARAAAPMLAARARSAVRAGLPFPLTPPPVPQGVEPPVKRSRYGADYDTEWARRYPARMARVLLLEGVIRPAVGALTSAQVSGLDRLEGLEGPVVFVANHHSHVDTPVMLANLPEPWRHHVAIGAAADYFFSNPVNATLSALVIGAVPIERQKVSRRSASEAADLIRDGWSFLIFPEGGRSPDGWGQPFRGGAAYLAIRCDVPVVPIHLEGTDRVLPKGRSVPRPSPVTITYGTHARARTPGGSQRASSPRSLRLPTRRPATGGRPASAPTPGSLPASRGRTRHRGDVRGSAGTAARCAVDPLPGRTWASATGRRPAPGPSTRRPAAHPDRREG